MSDEAKVLNIGRGSGRFRFGVGTEGTGGDIELELTCLERSDPNVSIKWLAPLNAVPMQAQHEIVSYIEWYLRDYLSKNSVGSLHVEIISAGWFSDRRNDPERAAWIALHSAIIDAKLPPPVLFASPGEEA